MVRLFIGLMLVGAMSYMAIAADHLNSYLQRIALLPNSLMVVELREADDYQPELPLRAWGHEPSWLIWVDDTEMRLITAMGSVEQRWPSPERSVSASGIRYVAAETDQASLTLLLQPEICRDSAVGMPHPYHAVYTLEGVTYSGCAGEPSSLLGGREWQIDNIAGQPLVAGSSASIEFLPDQRVAGSASCNRFMGGYELTGESLTFTQLASTMMACEESVLNQEIQLLTLLDEVNRFDIDPEGGLMLYTHQCQLIRARRP